MKGAEEQKEVEHRVLWVSPTGQVINPALDYEGPQQIPLWAQEMSHLGEKGRASRERGSNGRQLQTQPVREPGEQLLAIAAGQSQLLWATETNAEVKSWEESEKPVRSRKSAKPARRELQGQPQGAARNAGEGPCVSAGQRQAVLMSLLKMQSVFTQ